MMNTCIRFNLLFALVAAFCLSAAKSTMGQSSDSIQPAGQVVLVQDGYTFTEGPAWDDESQVLYFSDIPDTAIHRLMPDGSIDVFTKDSKHTNGILIPTDGRLLACQMDGQVVRYDRQTAAAKTLASEYEGNRFNAPNDLTVDSEGGIYFTDPLFRAPTPLPQSAQAVYYIAASTETGGPANVQRVTDDLPAPNGIGLSPDGSRLYVCPSQQAEMLVCTVLGPGKLSEPETFCRLQQPEGQSGTGADGIALDVQGNVYITTNLGVQIFSPAGKQLGLVKFPQQPANVCFGGKDWKTMFVTARTAVYKVDMPIEGLH